MSLESQAVAERPHPAVTRGPGIAYRLLYFLGLTPWEYGEAAPEVVELVEGPEALPPGRALDLGCGAGTQAVYLAQRAGT